MCLRGLKGGIFPAADLALIGMDEQACPAVDLANLGDRCAFGHSERRVHAARTKHAVHEGSSLSHCTGFQAQDGE